MTRALKVGLALLLAGSMWYYFAAVLIPHQQKEAAVKHIPQGNSSDLYPRWLGARELLLHGRDPYGAEITREIQLGYYGEILDGKRPNAPKDQQGFAYPAYVVFLLAPTVIVPFSALRYVFRLLLIVLAAASVPLWIRALGLRLQRTTEVIITLLVLGSAPFIYGLFLEQLTLLVCFMIAACCAALASRRFVTAGILLALSTIKPQLAIGVVAWLGLWTLSDWRRRKKLAGTFVLTMALLWLGSELLLPGWFGRWWVALHAYASYNDMRSLLEILLGKYAGLLISVLIGCGVAWVFWEARRSVPGSASFNLALLSVLAASLLIKPMFLLYDLVIVLPVVIWLFAIRKVLWQRSRPVRDVFLTSALLLGWQWISVVALVMVSLVSPARAERGWALPGVGMLLLPAALACLLGLLALDLGKEKALSQAVTSLPPRWPGVAGEEMARASASAGEWHDG